VRGGAHSIISQHESREWITLFFIIRLVLLIPSTTQLELCLSLPPPPTTAITTTGFLLFVWFLCVSVEPVVIIIINDPLVGA